MVGQRRAARRPRSSRRFRARRLAEAGDKLRLAVEIDPWNARPRREWAWLLLELERPWEANEQLDLALYLDPYDRYTQARRDGLSRRLDELAPALAIHHSLVCSAPNDYELLVRLGAIQQNSGWHEAAVATLRQALSLKPGDARARKLLVVSEDAQYLWNRLKRRASRLARRR